MPDGRLRCALWIMCGLLLHSEGYIQYFWWPRWVIGMMICLVGHGDWRKESGVPSLRRHVRITARARSFQYRRWGRSWHASKMFRRSCKAVVEHRTGRDWTVQVAIHGYPEIRDD